MPNCWGTSQTCVGPIGSYTIGNAAINCPAGTETPFIQLVLSADCPGTYFGYFWLNGFIILGTPAPTTLGIAVRVLGGADINSWGAPTQILIAAQTISFPLVIPTQGSDSLFRPPGTTYQLTCTAGTTAVTVHPSTYCYSM